MKQQTRVQRALGGHASIGLLASALLYLVALTGSVIVVHDRWQRWEQPGIAETESLSPDAAQAAMAARLATETGKPRTTHLYVRLPTEALPRAVVTTDHGASYVDGEGRLAGREAHSWTEFVIGLHEYLHLPASWGMILVGALGVAMAALVVTGVLAHPRIIRDAFCLRSGHDPQIARADWHNRLGVWTLPFALAIALTGAFIGLGSVGFSLLARAYTGGDVEAAYAPIFGREPTPDPAAAPLPDIASALRQVHARVPDGVVTYVIAHEPGSRGSHVQVIATRPHRLVYGETYTFDAAGNWKGAVGLADGPIGQQAAASTYNLHFGNWGGLPIEIAYMLGGLALCVVTSTGTTLWLGKRRRRGMGSERMEAAWAVVVWGSPIALLLTAWLRGAAGPDAPLVAAFWTSIAAGLAMAIVRPSWVMRARLRTTSFMVAALTGIGHLLILRPAQGGVIAIDMTLIGGAALVLYITGRRPSPQSRPNPTRAPT